MAVRRASPKAAPTAPGKIVGTSIDVLPVDALAWIFAFTPIKARLRTVILVCKRWRLAVERSVRHFGEPPNGATLTAESLAACFARFPCITSVRISRTKILTDLMPAALTRLAVNISGWHPSKEFEPLRFAPPLA